jgi:hypothetical protein
MVKRGIFISPLGAVYISYSHSFDDIEKTLSILDVVCKNLSEKISSDNYEKYIEGNLPRQIWTLKIPPTKKKR